MPLYPYKLLSCPPFLYQCQANLYAVDVRKQFILNIRDNSGSIVHSQIKIKNKHQSSRKIFVYFFLLSSCCCFSLGVFSILNVNWDSPESTAVEITSILLPRELQWLPILHKSEVFYSLCLQRPHKLLRVFVMKHIPVALGIAKETSVPFAMWVRRTV